jgi:hypothetical protein
MTLLDGTNYPKWEDEELDQLHSHLYAFLSFIDQSVLIKMGKDKIGIAHVTALKRDLDDSLFKHGGRHYQKYQLGDINC